MNLKEGMRRADISVLFLSAVLCVCCNSGQKAKAIPASDEQTDLFVVQLSGKFGYIDKTGRLVIQPQFDSAKRFSEGLAAVRVGNSGLGKWGYIDQTGRLVVPPKFISAGDFSDGRALANTETATSEAVYIDKIGRVAISPKQLFSGLKNGSRGSFISSFHEGLALMEVWDGESSKDGYINTQGKIAITAQFYESYDFNEGVAQVLVHDPV